jgi:hypothetical protein
MGIRAEVASQVKRAIYEAISYEVHNLLLLYKSIPPSPLVLITTRGHLDVPKSQGGGDPDLTLS